jgi:hypothetical protein
MGAPMGIDGAILAAPSSDSDAVGELVASTRMWKRIDLNATLSDHQSGDTSLVGGAPPAVEVPVTEYIRADGGTQYISPSIPVRCAACFNCLPIDWLIPDALKSIRRPPAAGRLMYARNPGEDRGAHRTVDAAALCLQPGGLLQNCDAHISQRIVQLRAAGCCPDFP